MSVTIEQVNKARSEWSTAQSELHNRTSNKQLGELEKQEAELFDIYYKLHHDYLQQEREKFSKEHGCAAV